jgi:hypothetical protein
MEILEFDGLTTTTFDVDDERRTIRGLVVPWGRIGRHRNGRTWRFARGALKYGDIKYVRFNNDHDQGQWLGRAIAAEDTDEGLVATFRVSAGRDGDRALQVAKERRKTGLSVEVEIDTADTQPDPENAGALLVHMANLTAVGFVKEPAFDDSRLISVTASADGRTGMDPETTTAPETPATLTFSADQLAWMQANGLGIAPPPAAPVAQTPPPARVVNGPATVTEPRNYRFDADGDLQPAKYDFGIDFVRANHPEWLSRPEGIAARQRVTEFVHAQFDVATGDVNELNPTLNLPKYTDQREYRSPVWAAINKGAPPNGVQPFSWPKFNSASGLVGAHTEGTEPTSGTLTTTNQTVTPTATSGKAKITRETWDMGGMPGIGNIIWRQMTRGYNEALEAKAVAVLDAASPTAIALTAGGGTTGQTLVSELIQGFARLHFVRGGFSMDNMFAQIDLYLALVGAKDGQGAPLFPSLQPTNRNGQVGTRFGVLDINGVAVIPSWALAATGSVVASSYLFDSLSVHGWATPPRQLLMPEIEVAHVYMGIWGYSAAAIEDINGVREITYDPVA